MMPDCYDFYLWSIGELSLPPFNTSWRRRIEYSEHDDTAKLERFSA